MRPITFLESEADHDKLLTDLEGDVKPSGALERCVVERLTHAHWLSRRLAHATATMLDQQIRKRAEDYHMPEDPVPDDYGFLVGIVAERDAYSHLRLARQEDMAERSFYRAVDYLRRLRSTPAAPPAEK